jgi:peroxiredoxin Q/BCP
MTLTAGQAAPDFTLPDADLAAVDGEVCKRYGVRQEREIDGVRRAGIVRSTFIVDRKGIIRHALYGVIANGHARKALGLIEAMVPC